MFTLKNLSDTICWRDSTRERKPQYINLGSVMHYSLYSKVDGEVSFLTLQVPFTV